MCSIEHKQIFVRKIEFLDLCQVQYKILSSNNATAAFLMFLEQYRLFAFLKFHLSLWDVNEHNADIF
jgi:hypothetical protein